MEKDKKKVDEKENATSNFENKNNSENQSKSFNKILKNLFITIGIVVIVGVLTILYIDSTRNFEYNGLKFSIEKVGQIIVYRTSIPVYSKVGVSLATGMAITEKIADYNFYLRNDPRKLESVPFDGEIELYKFVVVNSTNELNCDGDGIIAIANLVKLYDLIGSKVIKDQNATCDQQGNYMFLDIQAGDTTSIEQFGPGCYKINVNNCEILKATEKFMIETFIKIDELGIEPIINSN